jgi:outer membrane protein TolC
VLDFSARARVRSRGGAIEVSQAARGVAGERAAEATAAAYVRAVRASAVVAARMADVDLAARLAGLAQEQLDAGLSAGIDVTRAQTQLAGARGLLLVAQNDESRAAMDLARSMGLDPAQRFALTDTLTSNMVHSDAPEEREAALVEARAHWPDLELQRATVKRAGLEKSAVRAERLPSVGLEGDFGFSGTSATTGLPTRQLAVEVTIPLFDGLRRESRIAEQDAVIDAATARQKDADLQLVAEVDGALLDIASAAEQERVALEGLTLAQDEVSQAQERFERGVAGNIEVINAQLSLVRARDAVIQARAGGATARVRLARATGTAATIR